MSDHDDFARELRRYAEVQPSKAKAARELGITRQDLYRYIGCHTSPRPSRRRQMMQVMKPAPARPVPVESSEVTSRLDLKSVTHLRDVLIHLVSLIDLDLAAKDVIEQKGGRSK